jgi:hypothetical protein
MYYRIILVLTTFLFVLTSYAQDSTSQKNVIAVANKTTSIKTKQSSSKPLKPKTQVWVPPKITGPLKVAYKSVPGFRLQVINTTDRAQAVAMKTKMYTMFPNQGAYIFSKQPYYAVHQGNYATLSDAKKASNKVSKALNMQVYIINADIVVKYYPQLEPPNAPKLTAKTPETVIYTYGGKDEKNKDKKKGKRRRAQSAKTQTVVTQ